jgi:hypothetical protein
VSRRERRRRNLARLRPALKIELPPGLYNDVKAVTLKLALLALADDQAALRTELLSIASASTGLLIGIIGYLLAQFADGLERGYGGKAGAIDEVTRELAAAVLADSSGQS